MNKCKICNVEMKPYIHFDEESNTHELRKCPKCGIYTDDFYPDEDEQE